MEFFQILTCSGTLANCCNHPGLVLILDPLRRIISLLQIIVPILLIISATIEFTKLMMNPDRNTGKGGSNHIKNMVYAALFVFFIPMIVNVVLNMMPESFDISACWQQASIIAESNRNLSFQYVSPYEVTEKKSSFIPNSNDYEKGNPTSSGNSSYTGGSIAPGDVSGILGGAEKVHSMYEKNGWAYYTDLKQLRWGNVNYSTNNPSRMTCCATFVGSALYIGGVFPESVINKYNYNSQYGISDLCRDHGWAKITNYGDLAAGDIVIMTSPKSGGAPGHVQIYAGNGTWYNAGSTSSIQRDSPYSDNVSSRFLWAWRKP